MAMRNFRPADMPNGKSSGNPRETVTPDPIVAENPTKGSDVHETEKGNPPAKKTTRTSKSTETKSNVSEETPKSPATAEVQEDANKADTPRGGQEPKES